MLDEATAGPASYVEEVGDAPVPSIDLFGLFLATLRRWKLITAVTLSALMATYGVLKLVPSRYKSTVEILVFDPQQQINAALQKPINPFVDNVGNDAMITEIEVLKSKTVALRVVRELGLDKNPEPPFRQKLRDLAQWLSFPAVAPAPNNTARTMGSTEDEDAKRQDEAADALVEGLQVWEEAYILFVTTTSQSPIMAQRVASAIAKYYLASQREARQEALERVANWLKGRVDNLQSRVLETEASLAKLKAENDIRDTEVNSFKKQQIDEVTAQLIKVRAAVEEKRARLEQARSVIGDNGDLQSIPELTASPSLMELRQRQAELNSRATDLQNRLGPRHLQVIGVRADLATINQQISAEVDHILGNMKNSYDIAVRQERLLEANLQSLTEHMNSEAFVKAQQLQRVADADRNLYESYLSQYNEISERRTVQDASARIISPATLPRSPSSPRPKLFYLLGGLLGLGGGFSLACLLEFLFRPGVKTGAEIEQSFGRPVVGNIPLFQRGQVRRAPYARLLHKIIDEPFSDLSEAVHSMRISFELSNADSKVILITSALPGEGKSTAAMLLAASSANSGKRTILLDCDLHQQPISEAIKNDPGLSELLRGAAGLADVIRKDSVSNAYIIPAGSSAPNAADLLKSQRMRDLIALLRGEFDVIVMDTAPLLPVVDGLVLATIADKVLMIVEWSQTPRASISEAFKLLRPEAHRLAGFVLNKVDLKQIPRYGAGYRYRSFGKYYSNG